LNRYQKIINQIAKDDMKKKFYVALGMNFRKHRRILRFGLRKMSFQKIRDFKAFGKKLSM
jgi:hypothetical protein